MSDLWEGSVSCIKSKQRWIGNNIVNVLLYVEAQRRILTNFIKKKAAICRIGNSTILLGENVKKTTYVFGKSRLDCWCRPTCCRDHIKQPLIHLHRVRIEQVLLKLYILQRRFVSKQPKQHEREKRENVFQIKRGIVNFLNSRCLF